MPPARCGWTLVELLIVLTVSSAIIGVAAGLLHLLLRAERDQSRAVRTAVTLSRLEQVFRADVHNALLAGPAADGAAPQLVLTSPLGRRTQYTIREHVLERIDGEGAPLAHREAFYFTPGTVLRFEQDEAPALVRLALDLPARRAGDQPDLPPGSTPPSRSVSLEALLARDARFAGRQP